MDFFDSGHQLLGDLDAYVSLCLRAQLRRVPEGGVKLGVGLEMYWLEVVSPEDEELVLGDLSLVLLDRCLLYTSPSPRDRTRARMPSSA